MTPIEQVRESVTHELKCHPEPFQASKRGEKNFEFRKDDRDYRVGDNLHLREWMPGSGWDNDGGNEGDYTGDECHRRVDYIIREGFGIPNGYCIMSLSLLKTMEGEPTHSLSLSDAIKVWNLLPEWVRLHSPGLDPTFYGTLSAEGDAKVRADMVRILGIDRINVTHANVSQNISEETICALRDMLAKAYVFEEAAHPSPQSDTLTDPLPLSMTEDEMEEESHKWANAEPPWEGPVERTYARTVFKDGLRYASTHTKTITVDKCVHCGRLRSIPDDANP